MIVRWKLTDNYLSEVYNFPHNPDRMDSIFPHKNLSIRTTTAIDGQAILFEGNPERRQWSFGGATLNKAHHEELKRWSEKRHRIELTDHFGREFDIYITNFESTPMRRNNRRWFHQYTMSAVILTNPSTPTVDD